MNMLEVDHVRRQRQQNERVISVGVPMKIEDLAMPLTDSDSGDEVVYLSQEDECDQPEEETLLQGVHVLIYDRAEDNRLRRWSN